MLGGLDHVCGKFCSCIPICCICSCSPQIIYWNGIPSKMTYGETLQAVWQRLWDVLLGRKPEQIIREYHIIVTIFYLFLTITLCRLLRLLNRRFTPIKLQPLTGDIISSFQTLSCGLENGMVRKAYGYGAYCLQTFFLGLWAQWTLAGTCGNPIRNFIKYMEGKRKLLPTLLHMSCQMLAGLVAYHYARTVWYFELSSEHITKRLNDARCISDLNVPVMMGLFIELTATIIDVLVSKTTTKRFMFERYEQFAKGVFGICMTLFGLNLTGMYLNPANATIQTYGCHGNSRGEYILVYWCGPLVGAAIGIVVHQKLRQAYLMIKGSLATSPSLNVNETHLVEESVKNEHAVENNTNKTHSVENANKTHSVENTNKTHFVENANKTHFVENANKTHFVENVDNTHFVEESVNNSHAVKNANETHFVENINKTHFLEGDVNKSHAVENMNKMHFVEENGNVPEGEAEMFEETKKDL